MTACTVPFGAATLAGVSSSKTSQRVRRRIKLYYYQVSGKSTWQASHAYVTGPRGTTTQGGHRLWCAMG